MTEWIIIILTVITAIIIPTMAQLVAVGVIIGIYKTTINYMQTQLENIKTLVEKNQQRGEIHEIRITKVEESTKSAHKRLNALAGDTFNYKE